MRTDIIHLYIFRHTTQKLICMQYYNKYSVNWSWSYNAPNHRYNFSVFPLISSTQYTRWWSLITCCWEKLCKKLYSTENAQQTQQNAPVSTTFVIERLQLTYPKSPIAGALELISYKQGSHNPKQYFRKHCAAIFQNDQTKWVVRNVIDSTGGRWA